MTDPARTTIIAPALTAGWSRLSLWRYHLASCTKEGCPQPASYRLEADGTSANYCGDCAAKCGAFLPNTVGAEKVEEVIAWAEECAKKSRSAQSEAAQRHWFDSAANDKAMPPDAREALACALYTEWHAIGADDANENDRDYHARPWGDLPEIFREQWYRYADRLAAGWTPPTRE